MASRASESFNHEGKALLGLKINYLGNDGGKGVKSEYINKRH